MSTDDEIDEITTKIQQLELAQQAELDILLLKHRQQKSKLISDLQRHSPHRANGPKYSTPQILSHSKTPLHRGDRVIIRSKASIGKKGDIATVTKVAAGRVDIYVHRLKDKTWRIPGNLAHC